MKRARRQRCAAVAAVVIALLAPSSTGLAASQDAPPTPEASAVTDSAPTGAPEARAVNFSTTTDLVDDQVVTITGSGFARNSVVTVQQCRDRVRGFLGCEFTFGGYAFVEAEGTFTLTFHVSAILDLGKGPFDCRERAGRCELRLRQEGRRVAFGVHQPLSFVADSPLADPPTMQVTPATDLVDGQLVTAKGAGFHGDSWVYLLQCPVGATAFWACTNFRAIQTDAEGAFSEPTAVTAILRGDSLTTDCRQAPCALYATHEDSFEDLTQATSVALGFDPEAPLHAPATLAVDPATNLQGGDRVTVHGEGFVPFADVLLLECRGQPGTYWACGAGWHDPYAETTADENGVIDARIKVRGRFTLIDGRQRDCRNRPCAIAAWTASDTSVLAPITFAPR
jgi:hypothetical protein